MPYVDLHKWFMEIHNLNYGSPQIFVEISNSFVDLHNSLWRSTHAFVDIHKYWIMSIMTFHRKLCKAGTQTPFNHGSQCNNISPSEVKSSDILDQITRQESLSHSCVNRGCEMMLAIVYAWDNGTLPGLKFYPEIHNTQCTSILQSIDEQWTFRPMLISQAGDPGGPKVPHP